MGACRGKPLVVIPSPEPAVTDPKDPHRKSVLNEIVFPNQTNHYGTLFGGQALAFMDKAAFIAASRYCRRTVVTASSDQVDFHTPVRVGNVVELYSRVIKTGHTSMQVEVTMYAENLLTGEKRLCTQGLFTMVALDEHGKPTSIPPLKEPPPPDPDFQV
ncbi:acyl-CoA thioesterase [bacterium]|nr:acyl-CoA thioesterase [bacterium]